MPFGRKNLLGVQRQANKRQNDQKDIKAEINPTPTPAKQYGGMLVNVFQKSTHVTVIIKPIL